ncbi:Ultraviolet-B receptor UVR8 [Bienertia sinuspersici]
MEEGERVVKIQKDTEEVEHKQQEIWSWGAGTDGQLGTGKLEDEHTPQFLINLSNSISSFGHISLLSCGGAHVIALTSDGKVLSWGRGASGQLGHGEKLDFKLDFCFVLFFCHQKLTPPDSGCLFTCGDGSFGQLGHGDYHSCSSPMEVLFFNSKHVEQVACGMRHTLVLSKGNIEAYLCWLSLLVAGNTGEKVYGFGSGKRGQLGVSEDKIKSLSFPEPCSGIQGAEVVAVFANGDQSAALSADGCLYTWGRGFSSNSNTCIPQSLPSTLYFKQAALGWNHALILTSEDEVFMLGGSNHGVLSEPQKTIHLHNVSGKSNFSKVTGLGEKKVVQIAAGAEHSAIVTGQLENGQIYSWGWGEHGQLGLGGINDHTVPQLVMAEDNSMISKVYCGSGFTFALRQSLDC